MQTPRRRIEVLRRLARLREVERQAAALELAEARGVHGKLLALRDRSGEIAASYADGAGVGDGDELARQFHFLAGLEGIRSDTESKRARAEETAQQAMRQWQQAERRRDIVGDRLSATRRIAERARELRDGASQSGLARKLKS